MLTDEEFTIEINTLRSSCDDRILRPSNLIERAHFRNEYINQLTAYQIDPNAQQINDLWVLKPNHIEVNPRDQYYSLKGVAEWHVENEDEGFGCTLQGARSIVFYCIEKEEIGEAKVAKWLRAIYSDNAENLFKAWSNHALHQQMLGVFFSFTTQNRTYPLSILESTGPFPHQSL